MSVEHRLSGLITREYEIAVPVDHGPPAGERITGLRARSPTPTAWIARCRSSCEAAPDSRRPRPTARPRSPGWLDRALQDFRVPLVDQRGTGRSSPVGTLPELSAAEHADRLAHFRADAIVRD